MANQAIAKIDLKTDGFWVRPCGKDPECVPTATWPELQDMLVESARRLRITGLEIHYLTSKWITEKFGPDAPRKYEELYGDKLLDWLPIPPKKRLLDSDLTSIEIAYRQMYTDLQKFCVLLEQAIVDHRSNPGEFGSAAWFQKMADTLKQLLCYYQGVMGAIRAMPNPPVKRDIMSNEQRMAAEHTDRLIYRDFVGMQQLWRYTPRKEDLLTALKNYPEKAPQCVQAKTKP